MAFAEINPSIKLYELVDRNFQVLGFLERLGIRGNFGDRTVEDICASQGMSPSSFMLLYNFYVDEHFKPTAILKQFMQPMHLRTRASSPALALLPN